MRPLLFASGVALPAVCWLLVGGVRGAWAWVCSNDMAADLGGDEGETDG